jgi:uridine kinase
MNICLNEKENDMNKKYLLVLFFFFLLPLFSGCDNRTQEEILIDKTKAHVRAERERRNKLTPEQREAEDKERKQRELKLKEAADRQAQQIIERKLQERNETYAEILKQQIRETAHDPKSVEFDPGYNIDQKENGDIIITVKGRARNAFNALRIFVMELTVKANGTTSIRQLR